MWEKEKNLRIVHKADLNQRCPISFRYMYFGVKHFVSITYRALSTICIAFIESIYRYQTAPDVQSGRNSRLFTTL